MTQTLSATNLVREAFIGKILVSGGTLYEFPYEKDVESGHVITNITLEGDMEGEYGNDFMYLHLDNGQVVYGYNSTKFELAELSQVKLTSEIDIKGFGQFLDG